MRVFGIGCLFRKDLKIVFIWGLKRFCFIWKLFFLFGLKNIYDVYLDIIMDIIYVFDLLLFLVYKSFSLIECYIFNSCRVC